MPLLEGVSKKIISKNISELTSGPASNKRKKGIKTMMKKHPGMDYQTAKNRMAVAIAMDKAGKRKK